MTSDTAPFPRQQLQVALHCDAAGETLPATLVHHNCRGIVLDAGRDLPVGTVLVVYFDLDDFGGMEMRYVVKHCAVDGERFQLSADLLGPAPIELPDSECAPAPGAHGRGPSSRTPEAAPDLDRQHLAEVSRRLGMSVDSF